ncbi:SIR2 family NAD-dependent protein deacylase [Geofilum sp. OHC36d9]|uniref:SIR2 family NAD-dependent protein deacylase n=1 Tax=Geofilum sp. OHC36d9 TaxID=3458413 RepID=UPI0040341A69
MDESSVKKAAEIILSAKSCIAFTGAGVSVESGIPPFRGENSLWNRYDPKVLDLNFFKASPEVSWPVIKEIFYDFFGLAKPNKAHKVLARMEQAGMLKCVVTQNIDNLHQDAGSKEVYEFHGNLQRIICTRCDYRVMAPDADFSKLPLMCPKCGGLLKPDFVFFGEQIPVEAYEKSVVAARQADVCLIVGSTGEVMPAAIIPSEAKRNKAVVIEINPDESHFTGNITDIHLKGKAGEVFSELEKFLF